MYFDILDAKNTNDEDVKAFVNEQYYDTFIKERLNKDIFFTNRESAILFGIPSNFIEGVLVGRKYGSWDIAYHEAGYIDDEYYLIVLTQLNQMDYKEKFVNDAFKKLININDKL